MSEEDIRGNQTKTCSSFFLEGKKQRIVIRSLFNRTKPSLQRESGAGGPKEGQKHSEFFLVDVEDAS